METLVAACGMVCSKCEDFIGTRAGDAELIRQTAEEWSRKYGVPVPPEAVWCSGCMTEGGPKCAHCSQGCEVRRCVLDKKYCTCADCVEYPCAKTAFTVSEVPATRALLEALKKF